MYGGALVYCLGLRVVFLNLSVPLLTHLARLHRSFKHSQRYIYDCGGSSTLLMCREHRKILMKIRISLIIIRKSVTWGLGASMNIALTLHSFPKIIH